LTATTAIFTLSLHDARSDLLVADGRGLRRPAAHGPECRRRRHPPPAAVPGRNHSGSRARLRTENAGRVSSHSRGASTARAAYRLDRKSTRLNSSHRTISYAV